jgi:Flp pilus assembly protein CpaB
VAGAIQNGDFVDILISYWMLDTEAEPAPGGGEGEEAAPPESYILLAQLLLQDVEVLRVGPWAGVAVPPEEPPGEGDEAATPAPEGEEGAESAALEPVSVDAPVVLTLLLDQQDALVLKFARESGASIDLVLRGLEDHDTLRTETVSLEYVMTRFEITVPPEPMRFLPKSYQP